METWILERGSAGGPALPVDLRSELKANQEQVKYLATRLKEAVPPLSGDKAAKPVGRGAKPIAALAGVVAILAVGALGYAVLVPRAETTDASIAAALEQELPGKETAYCSHNAGRWHCNVSYPKQRRRGCLVAQAELRSTLSLVSHPTENGGGTCRRSNAAERPTSYEVGTGDGGLVASPQVNKILRKELSERIQSPSAKELETDETSLVTRAFKKLKGE